MAAGTIALTNNSAAVPGTGTAFTTDLKAGDFIVSIVGGVTYTLGVKSIESATSLTLIQNYGGPTVSGLAWTAVPNATLVGITAQIAADVAKAIRGLNLDKANWQAVYSSSGNITVTLADGSSFTGPSWNSIVNSLAAKAATGANSDITSINGLTTALSIEQGGTAAKTKSTARTSLDVYSKAETISNTYNDTTLATTSWVSPTPINGWSNNSGAGGRTAYRKMNGLVYIEINLTGGTQTSGTTLFNIPTNLAPSGNRFAPSVGLGLNPTVVYVTPLGEVKLSAAAGGVTLIANFCFTLN
ncbi:hypothetical protein A9993_07490 [Rahnella victoriana]|uniref:hypothetical protein n=1 Tax=Rahnella victoriana TaxID=1510570 RepID=UPI000BDCB7A3|nr:hypothetical protein [Rahnella victoriana]PBI79591.1 hypothetical protein A9993_07490 [Rahnella victoriana]